MNIPPKIFEIEDEIENYSEEIRIIQRDIDSFEGTIATLLEDRSCATCSADLKDHEWEEINENELCCGKCGLVVYDGHY